MIKHTDLNTDNHGSSCDHQPFDEPLNAAENTGLIVVSPASLAVNIAHSFVVKRSAARHLAYRALRSLYPEQTSTAIAQAVGLYNGALASALAYTSETTGHYNGQTVELLVGTLLSIIMEREIPSHG